MGVLGLWTLLEPAGKPVPVESLSHKVLAVDISIWLNQAVRGFRDRQGNAVPHAHLLGLYHRICKLLFYRIKPVFVFDGAPPQLKKDTLARRRMKRSKDSKAAKVASQKILGNYLQRQAVAQRLQRQTQAMENVAKIGTEGLHQLIRNGGRREKDLFELPEIPKSENEESIDIMTSSDSETDTILENVGLKNVSDVYEVDVTSSRFTSLPTNLQYEVLNDLKGKRKQNSWAKLHQMPQEAEGFSGFQMERLKRRREIQAKLEGVVEEISQEQREVLDPKLFVGDRGGLKKLKTETKRLVSRPDRQVVFVSGLREETREEDHSIRESTSGSKHADEIRELVSSDEADDPDISEAVAMSMVGEEEPSQEEILEMIKKGGQQKRGGSSSISCKEEVFESQVDDSFDDEVILIPTTSLFSSNRIGGRRFNNIIKEEVEDTVVKVEDTEVASEEMSDNSDGVGVMSSSDSDSELSVQESPADDLFADVFTDDSKIAELDKIIKTQEVKPSMKPMKSNNMANELLERVSKLDKAGDIFADISNKARKGSQIDVHKSFDTSVTDISNQSKERTELTKEISKSLKNGPGIMMKIASRWADAEIVKSSPTKNTKEEIEQSPIKAFECEQSSLLKEMSDIENANRLKRYTTVKFDDFDESKKISNESSLSLNKCLTAEERKLEKIGARSVNAETYKSSIVENEEGVERSSSTETHEATTSIHETLNDKTEENVVYMASAPGFVPSGRNTKKIVQVAKNVDNDVDLDVPLFVADKPVNESDELSEDELYELQARLAAEHDTLVAERSKASRLSNSITDSMYQECQEMLQMFGLPWVVAPGEAEAQCAQLDTAGLTEGTITDDSDIWLFGGTRVYKNFFDQEKYVEFFSHTDLIQHFGLNREKLICLALMTGSDYTEGLDTVGAVTGLEVLAEFPGEGIKPLHDFSQWSRRVKGEMGKEFGMPVGNKTREKLRKISLPESFPSEAVASAYLNPSVDQSQERFSWAVPNLVGVRDFAMDRFGWDKSQVDKLLKPVIRALEEKGAVRQARLEKYFSSTRVKLPDKGLVASSKRVEEALRKVRGLKSPEKPKQSKKISKRTNKKTNEIEASSSTVSKPEQEVSLIAASCGLVLAPSRDDLILQKRERERIAKENKEKAAEIFKKSQKSKQLKIQKKFKRPKRVELEKHGLSESDSD